MVYRLIKNEKDYEEALSRVEVLMDAKPNTDEMDELELLTALVELYEERNYPINPPRPLDAIKFRMDQLGLSQKDMVPYLGTKSKVSEVLNGKRPLTLAMMRSLNKNLGIPAEVLLQEPGSGFPEEIQGLEWQKFPITEMARRCWIPKGKNLKENAEELIRPFIAKADTGFPSPAFLRQGKGARYNSKTDPYSLTAWCIRVLTIANENPLKQKFKSGSIKQSTLREIARLSYFENGPLLAKEYMEKQGIHLIVVPHLPKTYLDGAAILMPDDTPVIGLTLRYDRIDNFWFCLLHELSHVAKHLTRTERMIFDDLDLRGHGSDSEDRIEREADEMAREGLIPNKVWAKSTVKERKAKEVVALAEHLRIHPAIVAGRIRYEQNNYRLLSNLVGSREVRRHFLDVC